MPARQALQEAALNRLRPITMSTLAMILALLPLGAAISGSGDQMLQPLAIAIIAGIIVQLPLVRSRLRRQRIGGTAVEVATNRPKVLLRRFGHMSWLDALETRSQPV